MSVEADWWFRNFFSFFNKLYIFWFDFFANISSSFHLAVENPGHSAAHHLAQTFKVSCAVAWQKQMCKMLVLNIWYLQEKYWGVSQRNNWETSAGPLLEKSLLFSRCKSQEDTKCDFSEQRRLLRQYYLPLLQDHTFIPPFHHTLYSN